MRIASLLLCLTLIIFWLELCCAASNFTLVTSFSKSTSYGARRDVRIVSSNSSWEYRACVADSYQGGKVFTLDILSNYSSSLQSGIAPNNGSMVYDLTVIQGLTDCGYAALVNTTLYNVVLDDTRTLDLGGSGYKAPFYAVWTNNQVRTFILTANGAYDLINATIRGTYNYSAYDDGMTWATGWQIYHESNSQTTYIAYTLNNADYSAYLSVVDKCNPECTRDQNLGSSIGYPTITANSTHWFSCYKKLTITNGSVTSGYYMCTVAGLADAYGISQVDRDYSLLGDTNNPMYSCVLDDTIMMLAVSDASIMKYSVYALDTTAQFAIQSSVTGNGYLTSLTCVDQVVVAGTWNGIDYYAWDNGTGIVFPLPPAGPESVSPTTTPTSTNTSSTPSNVPVFEPIDAPKASVNATGELSEDKKILVGVLVGVGVPVIVAAIVLIILRKKLKKKSTSPKNEKMATYTSINKLHTIDPTTGKLIPFKKIAFTKEIGSGSYGKVFLGTWDGKTVAIKMNNHIADTDGFLAEARLTLAVPSHPNLVQTYGVSMDTNTPYLVLEYCEGGSLDQIVFNQTIGHKEQRALVLGIAQGLLHLHLNKIVHRDLAVRNILLKDGIPKISDFGMSRVLKEESAQGKTKTTVGPIRWMAPESIEDMTYSPKSDVWTFGIVVSEIVLGHEPHHNESQLDVAVRIRDEGFAPIIPNDSDPVLKELMEMCWKFNPDDRPTMQQIIEYLYKYL